MFSVSAFHALGTSYHKIQLLELFSGEPVRRGEEHFKVRLVAGGPVLRPRAHQSRYPPVNRIRYPRADVKRSVYCWSDCMHIYTSETAWHLVEEDIDIPRSSRARSLSHPAPRSTRSTQSPIEKEQQSNQGLFPSQCER